jgi:hypothetical protein
MDGAVVPGAEVVEEGVAGGIGGEGVAEAAIAGALEDGVEDFGRGGEVHIGDPEGDDVLAGVFAGFGGVWVGGRSLVEVVGHGGEDNGGMGGLPSADCRLPNAEWSRDDDRVTRGRGKKAKRDKFEEGWGVQRWIAARRDWGE